MKLIKWVGQSAFLIAVIATLGHRFGLLHFRPALVLFFIAMILCSLVAVYGIFRLIVSIYKKQRIQIEAVMVVLGCTLLSMTVLVAVGPDALKAPMIHDITTDTNNPPVFKAIQSDDGYRINSLIYQGQEVGAKQRLAYPEIKTFKTHSPPRRVYQKALFSGTVLGWDIVARDPISLQFEAVTKTPLFGFVDDIVVRITPLADGGSAVDVRSMSRVGLSDLGVNAKRIRRFLGVLDEELVILQ